MEYKILIVDDKKYFINSLKETIEEYEDSGLTLKVLEATNENSAKVLLQEHSDIAIAFLDIVMEKQDSGLLLVKFIREIQKNSRIRITIITGAARDIPERDIFRDYDINQYKTKTSLNRKEIFNIITSNIRDYQRLSVDKKKLRNDIFSKMGNSEVMQKFIIELEKYIFSNENIYIQGESGTGKSLIAKYIHDFSGRKGQFKAINCGSIPETLFESEVFGYVKGAFNGADKDKAGYIEFTNNGTFFFDEINSLPIPQQAKILRVIETQKVQRLGEPIDIDVDVRFIFAGNSDLKEEVKEKSFRADLYHRMRFKLNLPPLDNRKEDIKAIVKSIIERYQDKKYAKSNISDDVVKKLKSYKWSGKVKGNVRELENVIIRAIYLAKNYEITPEDIIFDDEETETEYSIQKKIDFNSVLIKMITNLLKQKESIWIDKQTHRVESILDIEKINKIIVDTVLTVTGENKALAAKLLNTTVNTKHFR